MVRFIVIRRLIFGHKDFALFYNHKRLAQLVMKSTIKKAFRFNKIKLVSGLMDFIFFWSTTINYNTVPENQKFNFNDNEVRYWFIENFIL